MRKRYLRTRIFYASYITRKKWKANKFDEYTQEENGDVWAEMCENCATKYGDIIKNELDDGGVACGCCSVKGCCNNGHDANTRHFYIDFETKLRRQIQ